MLKKQIISLGVLSLLTTGVFLFPKVADAYRGDPSIEGPNCTAERHEAMTTAFANLDYSAWQELMSGRGRVAEVVNEENFARFAEAYQLTQEGKVEEAKQIRAELGLGLGNGAGVGQGASEGQGQMKRYNR
jgi:hypothetical protein